MSMISPVDLCDKFNQAYTEKWGYIYGKTHEQWTEQKQKAVENDPNGREQTKQYGRKWIGHWVTDCSGLFAWAFKELGGSIYHGSNSIWNKYTSSKGKLVKGKKENGEDLKIATAVFKTSGTDRYHIGLYIGNGKVIEAKGTAYGVVISKVEEWHEWAELSGVNYSSIEPGNVTKVPEGYAVVKGGKLRLRQDASTSSKVLDTADTGDQVEVIPETSEWTHVKFNGKTGYMMSAFLTKGGEK